LETLCDELQNKLDKNQSVTKKNFSTVNSKLNKLESLPNQLSQLITQFKEQSFHQRDLNHPIPWGLTLTHLFVTSRLPKVDMNKFDGSDPTRWVTQMEHYFSLHGIIDDLMKLHVGVLYLDPECWKWWKWHKNSTRGYISWTQFVVDLYEHFEPNTHHLGHLTKLKQWYS
jgi:hypothetical protein